MKATNIIWDVDWEEDEMTFEEYDELLKSLPNEIVIPSYINSDDEDEISDYISDETVKNFQPMGAAFGIVTPLDEKIRDKKERYEALAKRSLQYFDTLNL